MPALLIRHRVADYPAWRRVFDEQGPTRRANGCLAGSVFCTDDDPAEIVVLLDWDDTRRARLYAQSDEWLESITRGGIADVPDMWVLERADDVAR